TKLHEEIRRGYLSEEAKYYSENTPRGEFVIVIEGAQTKSAPAEAFEKTITERMEELLFMGLCEKDAMKTVAKERGLGKREVYAEFKGLNKEQKA
ncbi:MAG: 16S rRNA (cytidine(1402)-2'-O)-methyltransferase, partial [Firmicutes bacterium]|nr:16S rRNA (cytidine(1402)-2'-O)-methyltransferase [Bacillota bacterium]